jgi:hypothetical protein
MGTSDSLVVNLMATFSTEDQAVFRWHTNQLPCRKSGQDDALQRGQPSSFDQPVLFKISKDKRFAEKLEDIVGL